MPMRRAIRPMVTGIIGKLDAVGVEDVPYEEGDGMSFGVDSGIPDCAGGGSICLWVSSSYFRFTFAWASSSDIAGTLGLLGSKGGGSIETFS